MKDNFIRGIRKLGYFENEKIKRKPAYQVNRDIFNFSKNKKFNTRLTLEGTKLDQVQETKLLGLVLRDDSAGNKIQLS